MKEFAFRRQKLLDFRFRQEDEKKSELGRVQSRINTQQETISALKQRRRKVLQERVTEEPIQTFTPQQTALRVMMFQGIEGRISGAVHNIESMDEELERARQAYMVARRERLKIEKLKEKQREVFKLEERRKENKRLAEVSARLHSGKGVEDA